MIANITAVLLLNTALTANAANSVAAYEGVDPRYAECIERISNDLEIGRLAAQQWAEEGGGARASHCLAIADVAAGYAKLGAARLEAVSAKADAGDGETRARILAQAALVWMDAEELDLAEKALRGAMQYASDLAELQIIAAKVYASREEWQFAANAVTEAEAQGLKTAEAYIIRARSMRALAKDVEAAEDVVAALTLDPLNIDALTLRGELQQAGIAIEYYFSENAE